MSLKKMFLGLLFVSAGSLLFYSQSAFAKLEVNYPEIPGAPLSEAPLLPEYVLYIYYFAIAVSGFIAFGSGLYGAIRYLTSQGSPAAKAAARGYISGSIMGIGILLVSYIILSTINPQLAFLKIEKPPSLEINVPSIVPRADELSIDQVLELPIGTLIEDVVNEDKLAEIMFFMQEAEKFSKKVRDKASALKNELDNCSCANTTATGFGSCVAGGSGCVVNTAGSCSGEPCDRTRVEQKKKELREAVEKLKQFAEPWLPIVTEYNNNIMRLLYARALLQEGLYPINYDNFLELRQIVEESGSKIEIEPLSIFGKTVTAAGYDSMNFYLDKKINAEIIEKTLITLSASGPPEIPGEGDDGGGDDGSGGGTGVLAWPVPPYKITTYYGCEDSDLARQVYPPCPLPENRKGGWHNGLDIDASLGQAVRSAADGVVLAKYDLECSYGTWIVVEHTALGLYTLYSHLAKGGVNVEPGDTVEQGQIIAFADTTGVSSGSHLHFTVFSAKPGIEDINPAVYQCEGKRPYGSTTNPLNYLP